MSGNSPGPGSGEGPSRRYPSPMAYGGLGILGAICLLSGGAIGWLVDRALGTLPVFLLVGLCAGAALAVVAVRSEFRRYTR